MLPLVVLAQADNQKLLGSGLRRSYGDSGLNADGALVDVSHLDRLIAFDAGTGVLAAEAGLSLEQLLAFAVPRGYFLPATPGTKFVTLGGAVANDVHGKNHTRRGTLGRYVRELGLLRSDGRSLRLSSTENAELFGATIGGLGLTGLITYVALELLPVRSSNLDIETIPFGNVREFFALTRDSLSNFEHTVAWVDCLATGANLGRGIFTRANHSEDGELRVVAKRGPAIPFDAPGFALNRLSMSAFNEVYYRAGQLNGGRAKASYNQFFYPLDAISHWNRIYGARGMYQYQSVVPPQAAQDATVEMFKAISKAGQGSFLIVLKSFGSLKSPGLVSFPMEGTTLALDFPNKGESTLKLLATLDQIVSEAGGRLYPAKDGRLPPKLFLDRQPDLAKFESHIDPGFSSSFWRRMQRANHE